MSFKKNAILNTITFFLNYFWKNLKLSPLKAVSSVSHLQNTNCNHTTDFTKTFVVVLDTMRMNSHITQRILIQLLQLLAFVIPRSAACTVVIFKCDVYRMVGTLTHDTLIAFI